MWQPLSHLVPSNIGALANYQPGNTGIVPPATNPGVRGHRVPGMDDPGKQRMLGMRGPWSMFQQQFLPQLPQMYQDAFSTGGRQGLIQSLAANPQGALAAFGGQQLPGYYQNFLNRFSQMGG